MNGAELREREGEKEPKKQCAPLQISYVCIYSYLLDYTNFSHASCLFYIHFLDVREGYLFLLLRFVFVMFGTHSVCNVMDFDRMRKRRDTIQKKGSGANVIVLHYSILSFTHLYRMEMSDIAKLKSA